MANPSQYGWKVSHVTLAGGIHVKFKEGYCEKHYLVSRLSKCSWNIEGFTHHQWSKVHKVHIKCHLSSQKAIQKCVFVNITFSKLDLRNVISPRRLRRNNYVYVWTSPNCCRFKKLFILEMGPWAQFCAFLWIPHAFKGTPCLIFFGNILFITLKVQIFLGIPSLGSKL
jgi:hypothetical protein